MLDPAACLPRAGTRLLVSCSSACHYLYDAGRPDLGPLAAYSGHASGSFYIRACFSGDGAHILSGSSDHRPHIWAVRAP
jgi:WD40 repeat protein